ncbi:hypothetical protein PoB_003675800 [Plakobranchus ocellatus]|uniref:ZAD domain-containing protein n=1 Tax=Plakobranchus ocellatus TaxID=259542 RepID=A0AAV4ASA9_9GAST|nr:hypothetical protein PoB_003675800 [Plakobranchus ocellatus]
MEHLDKDHIDRLNQLSRLCGRRCLTRLQRRKSTKLRKVMDYQKYVLIIFHTNVEKDIQGLQSPSICTTCASKIGDINRRSSELTIEKAIAKEKEVSKIWTDYHSHIKTSECSTCTHYLSFSIGSRLLKRFPEAPSGSEIEENLNSTLQFVSQPDIDHDESSEHTHFYIDESEPESNTDMLMRVARALENETSNIDTQVSKNHEEI